MKSINRIMSACTALFISLTIVASLFIVLTQDVQAKKLSAVNVSGPIITNTIWTAANSPYILTDNVTVNEGITLTIEPGVTVMGWEWWTSLSVNGRLEAIGTPSQPITFTSKTNSADDEWFGIGIGGINGMGSAHLNHAVVQFASENITIYPEEGAPITRIENTSTQYSSSSAMSIASSSLHLVELDNVTFANNASNRIDIWDYNSPISLAGNTTLKPHPGLEGYKIAGLRIPAGITLTLEPGVTMLMSANH